jgi:4-amino-4-deoxy-L-arabinose transferase and related glycosyltransferases of PMT family
VAVFRAGREAFGNRQGLLAAAAFALVTPFLYYAKTANPEVPYVFWFTVSMVFYIRLNRTLALRDFLGFALAGTLSVCTKDQAYGLYLSHHWPLRIVSGKRIARTAVSVRCSMRSPIGGCGLPVARHSCCSASSITS